ncbi:MAG TPA: hypothetical protein VNX23_09020 [Bradyrhizobium sp.]|jgi:hypothetical protein|uniref:hypothetical protein n=1 Tax=Bradyrhizobium sp. TaxID=376 RepID=UPI002C345C85|nr:hypothetical protein [Bradyrhizobium sp.]HXB77526.1 hypothetical protein [Bradyrhizobium sp.]
MSQLTIFLARSIGLFTVLLVAGFMARGGTVIEATVEDEAVMISYAIISLAMGVAMVVGHNVWSGGALPVVVTLVGWLILAKGFTLLVLAPDEMAAMVQRMGYAEHYRLLLTPALVVGLYLTWAGFSSRSAHQN